MRQKEWKHKKDPKWGEGPWNDEPDKLQWIDGRTRLDCLMVRNHNGAWCGYVGVPPGHAFHGKGYDEVPYESADVHGGLTYAAPCAGEEVAVQGHGVCHIPEPGRPDNVWWFGFDCSHSGDLSPALTQIMVNHNMSPIFIRDEEYRDRKYVEGHVTSLALQLSKVA